MLSRKQIESILLDLGVEVEVLFKPEHVHVKYSSPMSTRKQWFQIKHQKMDWWKTEDPEMDWLYFNILYRYLERLESNIQLPKIKTSYSYKLDVLTHFHARGWEKLKFIYILFSLDIGKFRYRVFSSLGYEPPSKYYKDVFELWYKKTFKRNIDYKLYL